MRYLLFMLALVGCATEEPRREQAERQTVAAQQAAYQRSLEYRCTSYGFVRGTADFRNCLMQVDMAYRQQDAKTRNAMLQQILEKKYGAMPLCSSLPSSLAGYHRAQGHCQ
jgi:hypothetical protein